MIGGEGADVDALTDGGGKRLDLVEAAVEFVQSGQPEDGERFLLHQKFTVVLL